MDMAIPDDLSRFILRSIASVPHLEALLLLRSDPVAAWDAKTMSDRLYISEKRAQSLLEDLFAAGFAVAYKKPQAYKYFPQTDELRGLLDRLALVYSEQLVEVTRLIHSNTGKQAQQFGDAFRWKQDKD
jgi:hypothetical protein